jgi:hypothetical protein
MERNVTGRQDRHRAGGWRNVAAIILVIVGGAASPTGAQLLDRVLAVVAGTVITLSDARAAVALGLVDTRSAQDPIEAAMNWLVDKQLVIDEAARSGWNDVDEAAVGREMDAVRRRFPSDAAYRDELVRLGMDETRARGVVRGSLTAQGYVARRFDTVLPATEDELREYYGAHRDRFVRDGRQIAFEDAEDSVRAIVQEERRHEAVATWKDRLRRRADVVIVYRPSR